jgi:hypothetical protein
VKLRNLFRKWRRPRPIVIDTPWGSVTESARHQAALNMRDDPQLRARVEGMIINQLGKGVAAGLVECQRRYPECYQEGDN